MLVSNYLHISYEIVSFFDLAHYEFDGQKNIDVTLIDVSSLSYCTYKILLKRVGYNVL